MPIPRRTHAKMPPTVYPPMIMGVLAVMAWVQSSRVEGWGEILIWQSIMFALLGGAGWTGLDLAWYTITNWREAWIQSGIPEDPNLDKYINLAQTLKTLDEPHLEAYGRTRYQLEIIPGHGMPPTINVVMPEGKINQEHIKAFADQCDDVHLASIRWWAEGSQMQNVAKIVTDHAIADGYATWKPGPESAKWVSPKAKAPFFRQFAIEVES